MNIAKKLSPRCSSYVNQICEGREEIIDALQICLIFAAIHLESCAK